MLTWCLINLNSWDVNIIANTIYYNYNRISYYYNYSMYIICNYNYNAIVNTIYYIVNIFF